MTSFDPFLVLDWGSVTCTTQRSLLPTSVEVRGEWYRGSRRRSMESVEDRGVEVWADDLLRLPWSTVMTVVRQSLPLSVWPDGRLRSSSSVLATSDTGLLGFGCLSADLFLSITSTFSRSLVTFAPPDATCLVSFDSAAASAFCNLKSASPFLDLTISSSLSIDGGVGAPSTCLSVLTLSLKCFLE